MRSQESDLSSWEWRYLAEAVDKLRERKEYRCNAARVAQDALYWETSVLDSALSLITDTRLYYHGRDALEQAWTSTFEAERSRELECRCRV